MRRRVQGHPLPHGLRRRAARLAAAVPALLAALAPAAAPAFDDGADGRFEKRRSSHFELWQDVDIDRRHGPDGSLRFEREVLSVLEDAYDRLDAELGLRPRRPIEVVVYDPAVFDRTYAGLFRFPAAGFYEGTIRVRGASSLHTGLVGTLHHELVHAAFAAEAPSLALPAWMNEGLAEWFEGRATGHRRLSAGQWAALEEAARAGRLPTLAQLSGPSFARLGTREARLAYATGHAFVDFLERRHGARRLRQWVEETVRTGHLARATRRTFRADLERLEERFVEELGGRR